MARSKIIFIAADENKTGEVKFQEAVTNGKIDAGDLVLIEDIGCIVYVDSNSVVHKIKFSPSKILPEKYESKSDVVLSDLGLGQIVVLKDENGIYCPWICQNKTDGKMELKKLAEGDILELVSKVDENKTSINLLNSKTSTNASDILTNKTNIATNTTDIINLKEKAIPGDWLQNDNTKPDYIKNRTHYTKSDGSKQCLDNGYLQADVIIENSIQVGTKKSDTTTGEKSISVGMQHDSSGQYSSAFGYKNEAKGNSSFVSGFGNKGNGLYATSVGRQNESTGRSSFSSGEGTKATGEQSFSTNKGNVAEGLYSSAFGLNTKAVGNGSVSFGIGTISKGIGQVVEGKYNLEDPTAIEIIGGGTSDTDRKNIRVLDDCGNETLAGKITIGTEPSQDMDVVNKKYLEEKLTWKSF